MGTFVKDVGKHRWLVASLFLLHFLQIRLSDVDSVSLDDRRGYLTLVITSLREVKLLLRKTEGIREWKQSLEEYCMREKQQRKLQSTNDFWNRKQFSDSHGFQDWLSARDKIGKQNKKLI